MSLANSVGKEYNRGWFASGSTGIDRNGNNSFITGPNFGYSEYLDPGRTAAKMSGAYMTEAENRIDAGIGAAENGFNILLGNYNSMGDLGNKINSSYNKMNQYAEDARKAASSMSGSVSEVKNQAGKVDSSASAMSPYIDSLGQYGNQMFGQGQDIMSQAGQYYRNSSDILGLNADAGGLAGEYINALLGINPDAYVSMAANDVQSSFANQLGQLNRNLARTGVDSGSARSAALNQQMAQALAVAQAGAKTRARGIGLKEQLSALGSAFGVASNLGQMGNQTAQVGLSAEQAGGAMVGQAGQLQGQQGQLYGQAGQLYGQAGQLQGQQANAFTNAGQMTTAGGNLLIGAANAKTNAANALRGAAGDVMNAQMQAAQYYAQQAAGFAQMAGQGKLIEALGW